MGDQDYINQNLYAYVPGFSPAVRDIFERFSFSIQIDKLAKSGLLYRPRRRTAPILETRGKVFRAISSGRTDPNTPCLGSCCEPLRS